VFAGIPSCQKLVRKKLYELLPWIGVSTSIATSVKYVNFAKFKQTGYIFRNVFRIVAWFSHQKQKVVDAIHLMTTYFANLAMRLESRP
jgi:hypothetical protein